MECLFKYILKYVCLFDLIIDLNVIRRYFNIISIWIFVRESFLFYIFLGCIDEIILKWGLIVFNLF